MVRAHPDTFAAVDTAIRENLRLAAPHPDGLGGTALNTVNAALAQRRVKPHGVIEFIHSSTPSDIYCHGDLCSLSDPGIDLHLV